MSMIVWCTFCTAVSIACDSKVNRFSAYRKERVAFFYLTPTNCLRSSQLLLDPTVNQLPCQTHFPGNLRECLALEPLSFAQFRTLQRKFAAFVSCHISYHKHRGIRPGLRCAVAEVFNQKARFFHNFSARTLFEGLSGLTKAGHQTIIVAGKITGLHQQHFIIVAIVVGCTAFDEYDDSRTGRRPIFALALRAFLRDLGMFF